MGKYTFHPELRKYAKMNIPVMPALLPLMQELLGVLYSREKSDDKVTVERLSIPTKDGYSIQALLYTPSAARAGGPCLVFYHGGGFVYQAAPHHYVLARRLAETLQARTLFVDYRLAPKYPFPYAPEDAFDSYVWVLDHAEQLKVDPKRVALCGDSAGGNLAAAVCLMARDRGFPMPRAQMLLYPVADRSLESESMLKYTDTPLCNSVAGKKFNAIYFPFAEHEHVEYFSPVEAESLAGHPPTYVEVAEFDCLRDGGLLYEKRLREQGTETELHDVKGAMHGYDIATDSKLIKDLMEKRAAFLRRVL